MEKQDPIIALKEKTLRKKHPQKWLYVATIFLLLVIIGTSSFFYTKSPDKMLVIKIKWNQKQAIYNLTSSTNKSLPFFIPQEEYHKVKLHIENSSWHTSQVLTKNPMDFHIENNTIQVQLLNAPNNTPVNHQQLNKLASKIKQGIANEEDKILFAKMFSQLYGQKDTQAILGTILCVKIGQK